VREECNSSTRDANIFPEDRFQYPGEKTRDNFAFPKRLKADKI
jgi:hypothetical protein